MFGFFGGLGGGELLVLLALVLLLFGAKRLPELAKGLGSAVTEFKKGMSGQDVGEKRAGEGKDKQKQ